LIRIGAVGLTVVGGLVLGGVLLALRASPPPDPARMRVVALVDAVALPTVSTPPPVIAPTVEPRHDEPSTAEDTTPRARGPRPSNASPPGLAEELALLRQMRDSLARSEPATTLRLGKRHRKRFAPGALEEERAALEVRASCKLGRADAARRRERFEARWPKSTHATRIAKDCDD
jgi:hypothetical protein